MGIEKVSQPDSNLMTSIDRVIIGLYESIADALLGRTFFNGIKWDPQTLADRCKCALVSRIQS